MSASKRAVAARMAERRAARAGRRHVDLIDVESFGSAGESPVVEPGTDKLRQIVRWVRRRRPGGDRNRASLCRGAVASVAVGDAVAGGYESAAPARDLDGLDRDGSIRLRCSAPAASRNRPTDSRNLCLRLILSSCPWNLCGVGALLATTASAMAERRFGAPWSIGASL
jgi:hypothetical protein